MSVLVFVDHIEGKLKKTSIEAACYAAQCAKLYSTDAVAIALGSHHDEQLNSLGKYGISKVLWDKNPAFDTFDSKAYTKAIANAATNTGAKIIVISYNQNGKAIAPRVSARLKAGMIAGVTTLPNGQNNFQAVKSVYSGKAIAHYEVLTPSAVLALYPNSIQVAENQVSVSVENFESGVSSADFSIRVKGVDKITGSIPLTEAELVVSAGRGLKGPENWGMIEELANEMGAATACSRAVADVGWRPHHEHVGQTGLTIKPNLYVAVGVSGAIQHLAGVNSSKTIVVINTDPEAPFFKAADYGIVGDAFVVVPKLIEAYKKFKASAH